MTDTELARRMAICEAAGVGDIGEISDGFHTFNSLYEQRMILFATLVKAYKDRSWKSYRHEDGEYCFGGGWFVVGIDTPEGSYTYHYENKYWGMFDCIDLPRAKHWDGHTEVDAETRLMSLEPEPQWIPCSERLPEDKTAYYLATVANRGFFFTTTVNNNVDCVRWDYDRRKGQDSWHWCTERTVIAWMQLPEPWKEGDSE